ncbi:MAG: hypothetical protein DWQ05_11255 [Calditrichaeota bacterium]|nr:MAG: hypothetical protein DWQ05_11255 [Calditrichota bacterium]
MDHKINKTILRILLVIFSFSLFFYSCTNQNSEVNDLFSHAQKRSDDLRLSVYITAHAVNDLLSTDAGRREAISLFRSNGITKAYVEFYRGGLVIQQPLLEKVQQFFISNQIDVVGGIATVPGTNFGVRQQAQLGWFNWQNPKTQKDLKEVMQMAAAVFDEIIVDDFLCTADTSEESKNARAGRSWSQYRRDLLTQLSQELFIKPAKEINPDISIIIKYPQWYDRFHLFGYDVEREPALYDKVWVGTESRGQYTQRYGFVQPYEGFVNYRWLSTLSQGKISGAWFDHGDCDDDDFIEQAYQTVLAGAQEIVIFNYFSFVNGHKGHHLLRMQFDQLADLAREIALNPVQGAAAYKPAHSDAGSDLYLMDFIGMLGAPLIPHSTYPADSDVILLPTQAAADSNILQKIESSLSRNATLIFTTGFLANAPNGEKLAEMAGITWPFKSTPFNSPILLESGNRKEIKHGLDLEANIKSTTAQTLLAVQHGFEKIPFLTEQKFGENSVYILNVHTFSQADFDKVKEVLLCPKPLGLLEIPQSWANTFRGVFNQKSKVQLDAPSRICLQPLGENGWVIHNYNQSKTEFTLQAESAAGQSWRNGFTGETITPDNGIFKYELPPRSRMWIKRDK